MYCLKVFTYICIYILRIDIALILYFRSNILLITDEYSYESIRFELISIKIQNIR